MSKIGELIGSIVYPYVNTPDHILPTNARIGIEIELEGISDWEPVRGWRMVSDGSLRDGMEYVFALPLGGDDAIGAINNMDSYLSNSPPAPTFRCSTHIHVDVRDLTLPVILKYLMAYTVFEDVLFDHCDSDRRYSNFCVPFFISDSQLRIVKRGTYEQPRDADNVSRLGQWCKYTAFNLQPVGSYGSVEFRGSQCITKGPELIALAQRMLHLRVLATDSPQEESMLAFMQRICTMTLQEVFPTGLKGDYKRDPLLENICYVNGFYLVDPDVYVAPWSQRTSGFTTAPQEESIPDLNEPFEHLFSGEDPSSADLGWSYDTFRTLSLIPPDGPVTCRKIMLIGRAILTSNPSFGLFNLIGGEAQDVMDNCFVWDDLSNVFGIPRENFGI